MTHNLPRAAAALILLCVGIPTSCTSKSRFGDPGPAYPTALAHDDATLDIQVTILDTAIEFTNTSAITFQSPRIWLNRWYATTLQTISPGDVLVIPLDSFSDEDGRTPRPGGFFASRQQEPIVLVEIEHASTIQGLVVVQTADR